MSKVKAHGQNDQGAGKQADGSGEGDRDADRRYREATERFVAQGEGKVASATAEAVRAVEDESEGEELRRAEELGRARAKEHDPELRK
ncbi:MAG TPA: hypothetical protein VGP07_03135 [Polyangia bacterium]|jgi:hypothetical protein